MSLLEDDFGNMLSVPIECHQGNCKMHHKKMNALTLTRQHNPEQVSSLNNVVRGIIDLLNIPTTNQDGREMYTKDTCVLVLSQTLGEDLNIVLQKWLAARELASLSIHAPSRSMASRFPHQTPSGGIPHW